MSIHSQVKLHILQTCGGPTATPDNLPGYVPLAHLGFDEDLSLCRTLEEKLQQLAITHQTGKEIANGCISEVTTVSQCIDLIA